MRFIKIINNKKFVLISIFLFTYVVLNLLDGKRGLFSYIQKYEIKENLMYKKKILKEKLSVVENKNNLLTEKIDKDFLETIYRKKFMVGKLNEKIYINN